MSSSDTTLWRSFWNGEIVDAAPLVLPTGRIVVSDPILDPWNDPFTVRVHPGTYSVLLSLVNGDVARVLVQFREGIPERLAPANPSYFCVDSATGCLMDHKVSRFLRRKSENDRYDKYIERFQLSMEGRWGSYCLSTATGANIILFHTYGGDGTFPCFFGYDDDDRLNCFMTDLFPEQKTE